MRNRRELFTALLKPKQKGFMPLPPYNSNRFLFSEFCGHICPLGAFYSLISRFAILKVKYDLESCTHCMECKKICPQKQVLGIIGKESGTINSGECTRCGRSIEVCGDNALSFNLLDLLKEKR